jgi:ABC-type oligopeptide transport system substrate-binding subunit
LAPRQRLVCLLGAEPGTLDPALSLDRWETYIIHALFEGLTSLHPVTGEPMAGLATHYEVSPNSLEYTSLPNSLGVYRGTESSI